MADAAAFDRWLAEWLVGRAVKELTAVGLVSTSCSLTCTHVRKACVGVSG